MTRLDALTRLAGSERVLGIEISPTTSTYSWQREATGPGRLVHLVSGQAAETVSGWRVYRELRRILLQERIEVLFVPSYWPFSSFMALVAAKRLGLRVVMMNESHLKSGRNSLFTLAIKRHLVRQFDAGFVGGKVHRSFFRQLGLPNGRIFEGYDIVDNDYYQKRAGEARRAEDTNRQRLRLPRRYILSLGRFVQKKNLGLIVEAFAIAQAQQRLAGHDLVFVGDGPEKRRILSVAKRCKLLTIDYSDLATSQEGDSGDVPTGIVRIYPFAQIENTPIFYALASCLVLASRIEEWGLVVNEAMASGCPVVVSRVVGCAPDLVISGETGFRFNPGGPQELADHLGEICSNEPLRRRLGENAQRHVARWSGSLFAGNALEAARVAFDPRRVVSSVAGKTEELLSVRILQTCFPDYREPVFDEIRRRLGDRFELITGQEYFTKDVMPCLAFKYWHVRVGNIFFHFRNLLWQWGVFDELSDADVVVLELNPRILSSWLILINRKISGKRTLVWGHAWARQGVTAWTNSIRLLMMRLSDGVIPYSHSQRLQLKKLLPRMPVWVAPNSLISRSGCHSTGVEAERLTDILFVGRINRPKKPMLLLEAFLASCPRLPDQVRLVFIGAGDELLRIQRKSNQSIYKDRIVLRGHSNDAQVLMEAYNQSYCSVSPGYIGLSAIQSFAHGVPMIIADDEPHSPEIEACRAGFNCEFFRANDSAELAQKLIEMWEQRAGWLAKRKDISQWLADNYSTEVMVDGFMRALSEAGVVKE